MVNNGGSGADVVIDNIWDVTQPKFKNHIHTMDPNNENVNRDWLIMLTQLKKNGVMLLKMLLMIQQMIISL